MQKTESKINISVYLLAAIILLLPIDSALTDIIGSISIVDYLVVLYVLLQITVCGDRMRFVRPSSIIYLPLGFAALSIIWSLDTFSLSNVMYIAYFGFFIVVRSVKFTVKERQLLGRMIYVSIFLVIGIVLLFGDYYKGRLSINISHYIDPNFFCTGFVILIGLLLYKLAEEKHKLLNLLLMGVLITITLLSGSRGSLLAIVTEIVAFFVFKNRKRVDRLLLLFAACVIALCVAALVLPDEMVARFNIIASIGTDGGSGRLTIWKNMFAIYGDGNIFTKIFGYGREATPVLYNALTGIYYPPHNIFIKVLLETGIVGVILMSTAMICIFRRIWKEDNAFLVAIFAGALMGALFVDMDNTRVIWFVFLLVSKKNFVSLKKAAFKAPKMLSDYKTKAIESI